MIDKPALDILHNGLFGHRGSIGQESIAIGFDESSVDPRAKRGIIVLQNGIDLHPARLVMPGIGHGRWGKS